MLLDYMAAIKGEGESRRNGKMKGEGVKRRALTILNQVVEPDGRANRDTSAALLEKLYAFLDLDMLGELEGN